LAIPTSRDTLLRLVRLTTSPTAVTARVLGVDDFALCKGRVYGSILVDLERRRPLDLLPDRTAGTLAAWLCDHPGVEVIARDRSTEYVRGATAGAPAAMQVADRWHILKNQREALERMLNRLHAELARLPELASAAGPAVSGTAPGRPRTLRPLSASETAAQQAARERRLHRYQRVQTLLAQGLPILQIATQLGMSRTTVTAFAAARTFPERAARRGQASKLDAYTAYLQQRWAAGCSNASQLWRELQTQGYAGTRKQVARWAQAQRTTPAAAAPKKYAFCAHNRSPIGNSQVPPAAPPLAAPRQLVWLLLCKPVDLKVEDAATFTRLQQHPEIRRAQELAQQFQAMVRQRRPEAFDDWINACATSAIPELQSFAKGLAHEYASIRAALSESWSSGQVEGQVTRLKLLKRQMYGRAKLDLLRQRILHAA
jgi:transposase